MMISMPMKNKLIIHAHLLIFLDPNLLNVFLLDVDRFSSGLVSGDIHDLNAGDSFDLR